jgi:hypothetical protein
MVIVENKTLDIVHCMRNYKVAVAGSAFIFGCNGERYISRLATYKYLVLRLSDLKMETNPASETLSVL